MNNGETNIEGWSNINVVQCRQIQHLDPGFRTLSTDKWRVERCLLRLEMGNNVYVVQCYCHHLGDCYGFVGFCSAYPQNMLRLPNILNTGNDSKLIVIFEGLCLFYSA